MEVRQYPVGTCAVCGEPLGVIFTMREAKIGEGDDVARAVALVHEGDCYEKLRVQRPELFEPE